jgi:DNA-binding NtrC family response regulator
MSVQGRFRQDLYYRLNVMSIAMPPLRERELDVMLLAQHFAAQTARRYGLASPSFSNEAMKVIQSYQWPGNVREMRHQVSRAVLLCQKSHITELDLALPIFQVMQQTHGMLNTQSNSTSSQTKLDEAEKTLLLQALAEAKNNVSEAARKLGITRMTMRYRMDKHQIKH